MFSGNAYILSVLGVYFSFMLAIGIWARRSHDSASGYFLAGRRLPYWVAAFSMNATGESAWLILGLSGVAYLTGVQALWVLVFKEASYGLYEMVPAFIASLVMTILVSQMTAPAVSVPEALPPEIDNPDTKIRRQHHAHTQ